MIYKESIELIFQQIKKESIHKQYENKKVKYDAELACNNTVDNEIKHKTI
jgi:hypothetical protein